MEIREAAAKPGHIFADFLGRLSFDEDAGDQIGQFRHVFRPHAPTHNLRCSEAQAI